MINKLKTFAIAILATGATVAATQAETVYQTLSVQLTLVQQDAATINTHKGSSFGTITESDKGGYTINTAGLIKLLAPSFGISTVKNASLVKATTVVPGVNLTDFSNVVSVLNYVYLTNGDTNIADEVTFTNVPPLTNYTVKGTNYQTNFTALVTNAIEAGTNVQYYLVNDGIYYRLSQTNSNSGATGYAGDDAWYFFDGVTNSDLANQVTNIAGIFVGTITTNLKIAGTLNGDYISIHVNPNSGANGSAANPVINIGGSGKATATTTTIGKGKAAMPFSTWNATFDVSGSATEGGVLTNVVSTNSWTVVSNGTYELNYSPTPPAGFTNFATNLYTTVSVLSNTNNWMVSGTVKQTFSKASTNSP